MLTFTNTHMHVFTDRCVTPNFLRIIPAPFVRKFAPQILNALKSEAGRFLIRQMHNMPVGKSELSRKKLDKYLAFLNVALQRTQREVLLIEFQTLLKEAPDGRAVVLTMNMDYMDDVKPPMNFETQLADIIAIQRYHAKHMVNFLGIDPRFKSGDDLVRWSQKYFENGLVTPDGVKPFFSGIKLYPALGFFPFDARLNNLYAYAEKYNLPIMSHCTRVGNQYIGSDIEALIPRNLSEVAGSLTQSAAKGAIQSQQEMVDWYYQNKWIKNTKNGENDKACDLFGHPLNYVPLLEKFPNLKICLAHMGGATELVRGKEDAYLQAVRKRDPLLWGEHIAQLMKHYPHLYTDISYTLNELDKEDVFNAITRLLITRDRFDQPLYKRVLFGTDFFMTEQEASESALFQLARHKLSPYWEHLTSINPAMYLGC